MSTGLETGMVFKLKPALGHKPEHNWGSWPKKVLVETAPEAGQVN